MTLLFDLGSLPGCLCDDALDLMCKAVSEDPTGDERTIWAPLDNPWLRDHVEDVTMQFQALLERIQNAFAILLTGKPLEQLAKAEPADMPWERMTPEEIAEAQAELEAKPTDQYTVEDWMTAADLIIARYLPDGVLRTLAEYLTVRAAITGKIQATMEAVGTVKPEAAEAIVKLVPTRFRAVPPKVLTPIERSVLEVANASAAENISNVRAYTRHRMKRLVVEHVQAQVLGQSEGTAVAMRQRLFDEFGQLNRDFRRIAVTEAGECCNQGFVAAQKVGAKVKRQEAYRGACDFCQSINGLVFNVVAPDARVKNGDADVWLGKTNAGRSAAKRRRVGGKLVERTENERWWPAAGVQHPHCRGRWLPVPGAPKPGVKPEFVSWLDGLIAKAQQP